MILEIQKFMCSKFTVTAIRMISRIQVKILELKNSIHSFRICLFLLLKTHFLSAGYANALAAAQATVLMTAFCQTICSSSQNCRR